MSNSMCPLKNIRIDRINNNDKERNIILYLFSFSQKKIILLYFFCSVYTYTQSKYLTFTNHPILYV